MLVHRTYRLSRHPYARFAVVGLVAYAVSALALDIAMAVFKLDPYSGRAISMVFGMVIAWYGNRTLTFAPSASKNGSRAIAIEFGRSVIVRSAATLISFIAYAALVAFGPPPANNPFIALVISGLSTAIFNYTMMRRFVFRACPAIG